MATPLTSLAALPTAVAPMAAAPLNTTPGAPAPTESLTVPQDIAKRLAAAVLDGAKDAKAFAAGHTPADQARIAEWAVLKAPFAPRSDDADLKELHAIAAARTDAGIARAQYWSSHGLEEAWTKYLDQYKARVTPEQWKAARKLFDDAMMATNMATQVTKARDLRKRPYEADTTLKLAVDKPGNNPSHPSGHTSAAFAAAMVLAHLMPDRRAEFMALAQEASWARLYAGVHFPTDVVDGARLASTVTTYLTDISKAKQVRGTGGAAGAKAGAALAMQALPVGSRLVGPPLAGAVQLARA